MAKNLRYGDIVYAVRAVGSVWMVWTVMVITENRDSTGYWVRETHSAEDKDHFTVLYRNVFRRKIKAQARRNSKVLDKIESSND